VLVLQQGAELRGGGGGGGGGGGVGVGVEREIGGGEMALL
jgi:hypothetical protein